MKFKRVNIIHEHGSDYQPFGSAFIRLIRPFSHPSLQDHIDVTFGTDYTGGSNYDAVIVDRLWRPDISLEMAENLVNRIRQDDARFIYTLDDHYHKLSPDHGEQRYLESLPIVEYFLKNSDGVIVTTPVLREAYEYFNSNIVVLPHALDERILVPRTHTSGPLRKPKVIGFMGTLTHDEDFLMILPALRRVCQNHTGDVEIQIIGGIGNPETKSLIEGLPVRYVYPSKYEHEYPLFMLWYTGQIDWDIAIAPLKDTDFNRSKSDIKFLDYCAIAAAGVYSRVAEYPNSVKHEENGWLVENNTDAWVEALETLLNDDQQRQTIASNAYAYLLSSRILARRARDWGKAVGQLLG